WPYKRVSKWCWRVSKKRNISLCCRRYNMAQNTTGLSYTNPVASFIGNWSTIHLSPCQRGGVCGSPGTAIVAEFNLVCKDSWNLDLFQLYVNTRFFIGSMSIGYIADRMLITVLVRSVSGILMAFALSYMWMVISHLVQGLLAFGMGLLVLTAVAYVLPQCRWLQFAVTLPNFFFLLYYCLNSEEKNREKLRHSFLGLVRTPQIRKHMFILMYT
uniref:Uncharacterized protein n=1 Tax=Dromaius novaehollandiae TaxID=8790 RepID=A0A8C4P4B0_DRONO